MVYECPCSSTLQVLNNSSLVGDLGIRELQLYTGSITASSVEIGPAFELYTNPIPVQTQVPIFNIGSSNIGNTLFTAQATPNITNLGPNVSPLIQRTATIAITADSNVAVEILGLNQLPSWINVNPTSGTGNWDITIVADAKPQSAQNNTETFRTTTLVLSNENNPSNTLSFTVKQTIFTNASDDSGNGAVVEIIDAANP